MIPFTNFTTALINIQRRNEGLEIAQEKLLPDEEKHLDSIISSFTEQIASVEARSVRARGNTKTHGIVRAEFIIHQDLPENFRRGIFAPSRRLIPPG